MDALTSGPEAKTNVNPLPVYNVVTHIETSATAGVKCCCPKCSTPNDLLCKGTVFVPCTRSLHVFHVQCARDMLLGSSDIKVHCPGCNEINPGCESFVSSMHLTMAEQKVRDKQIADNQSRMSEQF